MTYTFVPKHKFAKAYGSNLRISAKSAVLICRTIRNKPLNRAKRLLNDVYIGKRSLGGKYYTKTVGEIITLMNSCEKNAEFLGLDADRLFVHASAHKGTIMRRRRRKAAFGSRVKATNLELMLIERGKESRTKVSRKKLEEQLKSKNVKVVKNEEELVKEVKHHADEIKRRAEEKHRAEKKTEDADKSGHKHAEEKHGHKEEEGRQTHEMSQVME